MTRDEIKKNHPLVEYMEGKGAVFKRSGKRLITNRCASNEHRKDHLCVTVDPDTQTFHCNDCDTGGSIIDFVMIADGLDVKTAMDKLSGGYAPASNYSPRNHPEASEATSPQKETSSAPGAIVATYDYTSAGGKLLFQVVRYEPKTFRQRRPSAGGWNWDVNGIQKPLYALQRISKADVVWVVEGEKDADSLNSRGLYATTAAGGAGKWEPQYTEALAGKDVVLCGDSDETGVKYMNAVQEAIKNSARSVRRINLPPILYKDVSEFLEKESIEDLKELAANAEALYRGSSVPVKTLAELEVEYQQFTSKIHDVSLNMSKWLPSLECVRPMVPGEIVTIVCDTGVGKSMAAYSLAIKAGMQTLIFQMELPGTLSFERFASMACGRSGREVHEWYSEGNSMDFDKYKVLNNIAICSESRMTPADIERIIEGSGLKTGKRPVVVIVDYVQLIRGSGKSRYETMSFVAEELKIIAKRTGTILVITSQVGRKEGHEVGLHDAKDSGQIENSSGLVLGGWRDEQDPTRKMILKVLKNTKGIPGKKIACRINPSLLITEDIPLKDQQRKLV